MNDHLQTLVYCWNFMSSQKQLCCVHLSEIIWGDLKIDYGSKNPTAILRKRVLQSDDSCCSKTHALSPVFLEETRVTTLCVCVQPLSSDCRTRFKHLGYSQYR